MLKGDEAMKKIYILLSRTATLPSKMIHLSLGGLYTHTSIAITPETDKLYSFARRKLHNFLDAGFMTENTSTFVFAKYSECDCGAFELEITDEAYNEIEKSLNSFIENKKKYSYNFLGVIPARLGISWERKYRFTCSQFVAYLLEKSGAVKLPKQYSLMMPDDFLKINGIKQVYSGKIGKCRIPQKTDKSESTVSQY
jgi:hypothetical protein